MNKSEWGPALWKYLHISASYCEDADAFCRLIKSVAQTMPCPECRKHLVQYLQRTPPEATIRSDAPATGASNYIFDLHNHVNSLIGKPPLQKNTMTTPPPPRPSRVTKKSNTTTTLLGMRHRTLTGQKRTPAFAAAKTASAAVVPPTPARGLRYRR